MKEANWERRSGAAAATAVRKISNSAAMVGNGGQATDRCFIIVVEKISLALENKIFNISAIHTFYARDFFKAQVLVNVDVARTSYVRYTYWISHHLIFYLFLIASFSLPKFLLP